MDFKLVSEYKPTGDQPEAIAQLVDALRSGCKHNTLLGVTGSGKTFTMANVIAALNKPTLIMSHNKTLAAQLYGEFKNFFPENAVEYFVSYYDYYQPEAYIPSTDTFIEKDLSINDEIEKMRLSTSSALLSGRNDIIVVSSVSCIYGIGNPEDFHATSVELRLGDVISRNKLLYGLVDALYTRSEADFKPGTFRVNGDTVDIYVAYGDKCYRVIFFDNEIEMICSIDPHTGQRLEELDRVIVYPANLFVTTLTKRMAEELYKYFDRMGIRCRYIHSDVDTLERVQILDDLRGGLFDVLIGVNLLREGLDLPEVSLVAIMDADKEGFLRSARSLTQTAGRAARNVGGRVIMYADRITDSMRLAIQDANRRREKQIRYNNLHGIVPRQAIKSGRAILSGDELRHGSARYDLPGAKTGCAADPVAAYMTDRDIESAIKIARAAMESAARELDFTAAAAYRYQMYALQEKQKSMQKK